MRVPSDLLRGSSKIQSFTRKASILATPQRNIYKMSSTSSSVKKPSIQVHRCRFVEWTPESVDSIAYLHVNKTSSNTVKSGASGFGSPPRIAVLRNKRSIELYKICVDKKGEFLRWFCESKIYVNPNLHLRQLAWNSKNQQLYACGLNGTRQLVWIEYVFPLRSVNID